MVRFALALPLLALIFSLPVRAVPPESTLDRIARTGVMVAGTRDDAPPFAFRDGQGHLAGLSVDLIEEVRKGLVRKLGREVRTEYVVVTSQTRVSVIEDHKADLACETATETWSREQHVDFTLPIFRDGTRILAYRETIDKTQNLHDLHIGIVDGSVEGQILREKLPGVALTPYPTMPAALHALEAGEVDGIANVGIVLRGLFSIATKRQGLVIVPRGEALGYETIACMVPENDSRWRDFVNGVFRDLFRGIDAYRGGYVTIYDRWFGRDAEIAYPLDDRTVQFFLSTLVWLD
jgi:polar amino acid transport system substrate-binding protein